MARQLKEQRKKTYAAEIKRLQERESAARASVEDDMEDIPAPSRFKRHRQDIGQVRLVSCRLCGIDEVCYQVAMPLSPWSGSGVASPPCRNIVACECSRVALVPFSVCAV